MTVRILGLSGSLRAGSFNTAALRAAVELAPDDVQIEIGSIREIPFYDDDVRAAGIPAPVTELQERVMAADAVLIATPEYNYSVPGVLKNTIDWLSRLKPQPFSGKPVGIIGASGGAIGTARAQYDLRKTFVFLNAHVMVQPEVMIDLAPTRFDADGRLTDETTRKFVANAVTGLRDWALRLQR